MTDEQLVPPGKMKRHRGLGTAVSAFLCVSVVLDKSFYLFRAEATPAQFAIGLLPAVLVVLCCFGAYLAVSAVRHRPTRNACRLLVLAITCVLAALTLVAAVGFWFTGSIPRMQQFHGLTWNIIAPSIIELVHKNGLYIAISVVVSLLSIWLLTLVARRLHWHKALPWYLAVVVVVGLALAATVTLGSQAGNRRYTELIASRFFRSDLDLKTAASPEAQRVAAEFFKNYFDRLGQRDGPRYADILSSLKGSNVILLVMESVRARDVPLYGGPAVMPNFMAARQHMILFQHLYSQEPRSTKAFAELDMGRFSLLSWNSYSDNIPWMFPEDGIASHLDKLGYQTFSFVNADNAYDHNKSFQEHHGYQLVLYRQALNPGTPDADDLKMLARVKGELANAHQPFYMMLWPMETHHPYGREYWSHEEDWMASHPAGIKHLGAADHGRYLHALGELDDWFGRLIQALKAEGLYDNTVIIALGDHGEAFGEHEPGNVFHGNGVYQESVHVAGFIYSPKIDGLHVDERNLRLVDIPATILNLASGDQYLLNAGRSIFYDYKYAMPVYLFNSWAGAIGIIYDGYKLWHRDRPGAPVYFASMADIKANPAMERHVATGGHDQTLLAMLNEWEVAMKAKTAELLVQKATTQPPLNDVMRVYCDDGKGFREGFKGRADFTGLSGTITVAMDKDCRAIRIAPIQSTKVPAGEYLEFDIKKLDVVADDRSWNLDDVDLVWSNDLHVIDKHSFKLPPGGSPAFDYKLGSANHHIKWVKLTVAYTWKRVRTVGK